MATMARRPDKNALCAAFLAVVKDTGGSMLISMCKQRTFFPNDGVPRDARKAARDVVVKLIEQTLPYDFNPTVSECTKALYLVDKDLQFRVKADTTCDGTVNLSVPWVQ